MYDKYRIARIYAGANCSFRRRAFLQLGKYLAENLDNEVGNKNISVHVKDVHGKEKDASGIIMIAALEISEVSVQPVTGLKVPVSIGTKIADITTTGGTEPYTYTLPSGMSNNDKFKIENNIVVAKEEITQGGSYGLIVKATDIAGKTKNSRNTAFTISAT